jgi:hypothetical protein
VQRIGIWSPEVIHLVLLLEANVALLTILWCLHYKINRMKDRGKGAFIPRETHLLHDCFKGGYDTRVVQSETPTIFNCSCMYCLPMETHVERTSEEIRLSHLITTTSGFEKACSDERKLATHLMIHFLVIQKGVMLPLTYPGSSHLVRRDVIRKRSDEHMPIVPVSSCTRGGLKRLREIIKNCFQFGKIENNCLSSVRVVCLLLNFRKQTNEKTARKHWETLGFWLHWSCRDHQKSISCHVEILSRIVFCCWKPSHETKHRLLPCINVAAPVEKVSRGNSLFDVDKQGASLLPLGEDESCDWCDSGVFSAQRGDSEDSSPSDHPTPCSPSSENESINTLANVRGNCNFGITEKGKTLDNYNNFDTVDWGVLVPRSVVKEDSSHILSCGDVDEEGGSQHPKSNAAVLGVHSIHFNDSDIEYMTGKMQQYYSASPTARPFSWKTRKRNTTTHSPMFASNDLMDERDLSENEQEASIPTPSPWGQTSADDVGESQPIPTTLVHLPDSPTTCEIPVEDTQELPRTLHGSPFPATSTPTNH